MSKETFSELFQKSLDEYTLKAGDIAKGTVVGIDDKYVLVDVGLKSEGVIPKEQFFNPEGELAVKEGDEVDVIVEMLADDFGETRLSREKARRAETWKRLVDKHDKGEYVTGYVSGRVKGGFTIEIDGVRAFLPGSLVDVRTVADTSNFEGNFHDFQVIKIDEKRNNIVVSRRAVLEATSSEEREKLLSTLEEGQVIKGVVKNLTDYGAFIDLGGIDGLLHITDIAWKRVKKPSELLKIGEEIEVVVLKFEREKQRVSLGMKQLSEDPWLDIKARYPVDKKLSGRVTNLTDYGCFVELEQGVEGLVHMSEMDWTNKNIHPSKVVKLGDAVDVIVLEIDEERRRISLGMKQCAANPWKSFAEKHSKGDRIKGSIKSITEFGIFIGLEGNIDGLVHLSDISWDLPGEQAIRDYKKGDEIEVVILGIDDERERISLGVKQLIEDAFMIYADANSKGSIVKGTIKEVEPKFAIITLADGVEGRIKAGDVSPEAIVKDATEVLTAGDEVDVRILGVNHKDRLMNVSIRAVADEHYNPSKGESDKPEKVQNTTLGDLLKEHMESKED